MVITSSRCVGTHAPSQAMAEQHRAERYCTCTAAFGMLAAVLGHFVKISIALKCKANAPNEHTLHADS
jgi:hypothetical protein